MNSNRKITKEDKAVIDFIIDYYSKTYFYPTYDEIAEKLYCSKSTVFRHMEKLEQEGIIVFKEGSKQYRLINMELIIGQRKVEN